MLWRIVSYLTHFFVQGVTKADIDYEEIMTKIKESDVAYEEKMKKIKENLKIMESDVDYMKRVWRRKTKYMMCATCGYLSCFINIVAFDILPIQFSAIFMILLAIMFFMW